MLISKGYKLTSLHIHVSIPFQSANVTCNLLFSFIASVAYRWNIFQKESSSTPLAWLWHRYWIQFLSLSFFFSPLIINCLLSCVTFKTAFNLAVAYAVKYEVVAGFYFSLFEINGHPFPTCSHFELAALDGYCKFHAYCVKDIWGCSFREK